MATATTSIHAADLDGDGDHDVLSASFGVTTRSRGTRTEGQRWPLRRPAGDLHQCGQTWRPILVYAADLDGDGRHRRPLGVAGGRQDRVVVYVNNANLTPGNEYYNIFSTTPCPGAVGSGPYLGLCAASLGDFLAQVSLPIGAAPFHIIAPSSHVNWGPYTLPPVIVDAVCFDYTGGVLGPVSPVFRITVQ